MERVNEYENTYNHFTSEENKVSDVENNVTSLQATLFPPQSTLSTSYFANFLVKNQNDQDAKYKFKETPPKEWWNLKEPPFDLQPPRWPTECQVLEERVHHISVSPAINELYYVLTGTECQPKPSGEECGKVVYHYTPLSAVNYFSRSSVGGNKFILPSSLCPHEDTLKFESRFESGNLAKAIMITPTYYELHLRADLYTNRHMHWYYFRISNVRKGFLYRFAITNCSKESSLYNEGLKPLMYSTKDSQLHNIGWRRCGSNISYYCNENGSEFESDQPVTYSLTFTLRFPHDNDEVYLAQSYPYTYSDLQDYLLEMSTHPVKSTFTTIRPLCRSLAGNNVPYVTITSPSPPGETKTNKKAIVLTARVHPGETPSSWIMKGIMDFLSSDSSTAKELRNKFIFKIVPMLNPDGVIVGNNRCSLSAKDLNRQYRTVIRDAYPSIWYTKLMIRRLIEECGVAMYCDLHGHSRKHNMFVYGCESRRDRRLQEQVFPLMLHKNAADKFSFESCKFKVTKNKEGTGRVVMWMMGIANSYTLESSLAGSTLGNRSYTHFTIQDFEQMGKTFCQTLLDFYDNDPKKERLRTKIVERLTKEGSNADEPMNIKLSDYSSDAGDTSSSSDEVGKDYGEEIQTPMVPPSSPVLSLTKSKSKTSSAKTKCALKSPSILRKPLPICRATLKLSLSDKESSVSSSLDSESDVDKPTKNKIVKRRKKKKHSRKKKRNRDAIDDDKFIVIAVKALQDHSDTEILINKTKRTISVFDLLPADTLNNHVLLSTMPRTKTIQTLKHADKKNEISKQLAEVQVKLFTLKNKLWFGVGNGDTPLAWGKRSMEDGQKKSQKDGKTRAASAKRCQKSGKNSNSKERKDNEAKEKSTTNGIKKKTILDIIHQKNHTEKAKLRKSKSLPDTSTLNLMTKTKAIGGDEEKEKKKKKKIVKKVKAISNARTFTNLKKTE